MLDADEDAALDQLTLSPDRTELRYYEHAFPVAPGTGDEGSPREVHERQHYRLASWKLRRRRTDLPPVLRRLDAGRGPGGAPRGVRGHARRGAALGRRGRHRRVARRPPGRAVGPGGYARRLRAAIGADRWLVVEKILGVGEVAGVLAGRRDQRVRGAARGVRRVRGSDGAGLLTQLAAEHTGGKQGLHDAEHAARLEVAGTILAAEVARITRECRALPGPEITEDAVAELLCGFPVYRSYRRRGARRWTPRCRWLGAPSRPRRPAVGLHAAMLADPHGAVATRIQQTSGMVMAKGVEDTTFYRWNRFVALNEVGGDPARFGVPPAEFHAAMAEREAARPATMTLTLSTHDTKRLRTCGPGSRCSPRSPASGRT